MIIIDLVILILIAFGAVMGFRRGFLRTLIETVGIILAIILAFYLRSPLASILYQNLPFFRFGGLLRNIEIINILVYEVIAFLIVLGILFLILKLVIFAATIFEKILKATIVLAIPSRIAGAVVGAIKWYVIAFVVLFIISLPIFGMKSLTNRGLANFILNKTPILSHSISEKTDVINEFVELRQMYADRTISEAEFNYQAIEVFLKHRVVTSETLERLIDSGKIERFDGYRTLLDRYKGR